jgi:3'(2'), 5'-bisphosphate nucleotidase
MAYLLRKILEDSVYAAYDAGKIILGVYSKDFSVEYKDDRSPLTEADKKSNDLICGRLKKYAPYIGMLAEESADDKKRLENKFCFIVDPLDGTKEFIKKNGEFTVNIGLAYKNMPVMGVVYAPCLNKLYYAAKDFGAYAADLNKDILKLFDEKTKIKVSEKTEGLTAVKSRSHSDEKTEALLEKNKHKIKNTADVGSALKGCLVAEGAADVYYRFGCTMEWDTCAMQCVVEQAGGIFVQTDFSAMTYNRENSKNEKGFIILNRIENRLEEA